MSDETLPAIPMNAEARPFFEAAKEGRFMLRRCGSCGKAHWYPRSACPFCFGETAWEDASGKGAVYSFSIMRRMPRPYAIAYVTLVEGPTLLTNIVDCNLETLRIGQPVEIAFRPMEDGSTVPCFRPA